MIKKADDSYRMYPALSILFAFHLNVLLNDFGQKPLCPP